MLQSNHKRITKDHIEFVREVNGSFTDLRGKFPPYLVAECEAVEKDDLASLGKYMALAIIELSSKGNHISRLSSMWMQLFGTLDEFRVLT